MFTGVHGPADDGVAHRRGDAGDHVEQPEVRAGELGPAEGGDELHHERLGDHDAQVEQQRPGQYGQYAQRGAAGTAGRRHRAGDGHRRYEGEAHQDEPRADPPRPVAAPLERAGDPHLEREVGDGSDEEDEAGRAVPAGGPPSALGQQQVQLVLEGEHADHGQREGHEDAVAEDFAPVAEDAVRGRGDRVGRQHQGLRDGEQREEAGGGERGGPEVDEQQDAAEQRPDQGAGGREHVEEGERLGLAVARLLREVGPDGGVEQRAGQPAEDGGGDEYGQAVAEREEPEADGPQRTAGDDDPARAQPVGRRAADEEQPLLAQVADAEHDADDRGGHPQVLAQVHGEVRDEQIEAGVDTELVDQQQPDREREAAHLVPDLHCVASALRTGSGAVSPGGIPPRAGRTPRPGCPPAPTVPSVPPMPVQGSWASNRWPSRSVQRARSARWTAGARPSVLAVRQPSISSVPLPAIRSAMRSAAPTPPHLASLTLMPCTRPASRRASSKPTASSSAMTGSGEPSASRDVYKRQRVAGGDGLLHGLDPEVRVTGQQGLCQGGGPGAVGVEQQPGVRRGLAHGPYAVEVVLGVRGTRLDLEDGEALPDQAARLLRGRAARGDAEGAGGGGARRSGAAEQPVHGEARALADEVEQRGLHRRGHRGGRAGSEQLARAQGFECGLRVGTAGEFACGPVQQPAEGGGVQSVVGAGDGFSVAASAVVFDAEPYGVAGRHRGAGYP